jgi:regulator of sirC expression with transglutaminase-like and TPR domain
MEIASRLNIPLQGLPLPGHFAVGKIEDGKPQTIIDVYNGAKVISRKEAEDLVFNTSGVRLREEHYQPATKQDMIVRMLRNLIGISNNTDEPATVIRYLDTLLLLEPNAPQERLNRALMHMKQKKNAKAKEDVRWLLENNPPGFNRERLLDLFQRL